MTDIPEYGWHIERNVHGPRYHRLRIDGKHFAFLTTEQADAFPSSEEKLPEGIRAGYLLDPGKPCPEGWEKHRFHGGWSAAPNPYVHTALEARRIPTPTTERVPWWEAVGRTLPDGGSVHVVGGSSARGPWCRDADVHADGTVEVLVEDS